MSDFIEYDHPAVEALCRHARTIAADPVHLGEACLWIVAMLVREAKNPADFLSNGIRDLVMIRHALLENAPEHRETLKAWMKDGVVDRLPVAELDDLEVNLFRAEDGKLIVEIDGPGDGDCKANGSPDIRIWLGEECVYGKPFEPLLACAVDNIIARMQSWREAEPGDEDESPAEIICDAEDALLNLRTATLKALERLSRIGPPDRTCVGDPICSEQEEWPPEKWCDACLANDARRILEGP